ncbi:hypothetical protein Hanom_Chr11g00982451 [Helianthus anomalus]
MLAGVKNEIGIREVVWISYMESSNQHNDNHGIPMSIEIEQLLAGNNSLFNSFYIN